MLRLLDRSFDAPEENLALDEALLDALQAGEGSGGQPAETLRFWESPRPFIVLGRSGKVDEEVDRDACARAGVPILRRVSGGGTVVIGRGSMNFALVLSLARRPEHRDIRRSIHVIVTTIAEALAIEGALSGLHLAGTSDLCWGEWKVSGNAQRRTRDALLHHGTMLYDLDVQLMASLLREPPRQPAHRAARRHLDFVRNLPLSAEAIKRALAHAWGAIAQNDAQAPPAVASLVARKYANPRWNEAGLL
jgi:lipoate---protein ligase